MDSFGEVIPLLPQLCFNEIDRAIPRKELREIRPVNDQLAEEAAALL